jgi:co-chaperonin GroES (HSP10)
MDFPTSKNATNMQWFSDTTISDPKDLPDVKAWRILVRPIPNAPKTKGGIYIPDQTLDYLDVIRSVGRVVSMGPLAYKREDMWVDGEYNPWCKVGDFILYPRYAGAKISYGGVRFLLLNDDECLAVIHDPSRLNE